MSNLLRLNSGSFVAAGLALFLPLGSAAQQDDWCERMDQDDTVCEVREYDFRADGDLVVDGGVNGGISVSGWSGDEVRVEARVSARARNETRALEMLEEVQVRAGAEVVESTGPDAGRRENWSVSYRIMVPHETDLELDTHNGGIKIADVRGDIRFRALNGGVSVEGASGDVSGQTTNGGIDVQLTGQSWDGAGLDLETTNGGVVVAIPEGYSAELETGTVNGGLDLQVPLTVQGKVGRRLRSTLGDGGAPVRLITTNGRVKVVRATP
ncbi:MAG: DUF4097 family beta strand repeat-containing protein [Longimicrobiales bacterium]